MFKLPRFAWLPTAALLLLGGCKSADQVVYQPSPLALTDRLPSLEVAVEESSLALAPGARPDDAHRLFEREVRMNLSDPEDTARFGYARLQIRESSVARRGRFWQGLQLATFLTPALLGVPLESYESELTAVVRILSAQGDTLGAYTAVGRARVPVAFYYGYSQGQAHRVADLTALRAALARIKPQLAGDSRRMREELLAAGPLDTAIGSPAEDAEPTLTTETQADRATH